MKPARFIGSAGGFDLFERDRVVFALAKLSEDLSPAVRSALAIRREAMISGQCRCGAVLELVAADGGVAEGRMAHADDCPAGDEALARLAEGS